MLHVGLTGGIGAGKSTVAARLAEHGATVIDADAVAREVVEPGTDGLTEIVDVFGADVLAADGSLDRTALAARAFADDASRQRLNSILHPRIGARTNELMQRVAQDAVVVHDVPLLVEGDLAPNYHLVIVVDADEELRIRRLSRSRGMEESDARARIAAQASSEQRSAVADVGFDNSGEQEELLSAVDTVWTQRIVPYEENLRLARVPQLPANTVPPDPAWPEQAERMLARIRRSVGEDAARADHIGVTAVGFPARDVLELQLTVATLEAPEAYTKVLAGAGFVPADEPSGDSDSQPSAPEGERRYAAADPQRPAALYLRSVKNPDWRQAVLFRDWLRAHPDEMSSYRAIRQQAEDRETEVHWIRRAGERAEQWALRSGWRPDEP